MRLTDWWNSEAWHAYERANRQELGTRARLLASATWQTRVVDLSQDEAALWRGVRKSYHSLVNRLTRQFRERTYDDRLADVPRGCERQVTEGEGAGYIVRTCELLHKADSGRQTRSDETWQLMGEWAETGHGLFVDAMDWSEPPDDALVAASPLVVDGQPLDMGTPMPIVGFVYFVRNQDWAYYFSAASIRRDVNIALVWWAMLALKARGVRWCELGWQGEAQDDKGRGIEFFRRGFGGTDLVLDSELEVRRTDGNSDGYAVDARIARDS
jgi:hypothetical protein